MEFTRARYTGTTCKPPAEELRAGLPERWFLAVLFAAAFVVRLWGVSRMHGWDENVYLQNAELICCGKTNYNEIDSRPPLLSLLFAGALLLWHSDYAAYVVTAVLNALGPVLLYLAGRRLVGRQAAGIAALLMAFTPFWISVFPAGFTSMVTGHGLLSDCPAITLILAGFWLLLRGLEEESTWAFAGAGSFLALAVLMRFPSLASAGVLSLLTLASRRKVTAACMCAAGFLLGMLPYLGWSRWKYGGYLATFLSGWDNFSGPGQSPWFYVRHAGTLFGWLTLAGLCLWLAARLWNLVSARGLGAKAAFALRWEGFLWFWALALLACFSLLQHKEPRYAMPAGPPLFLLGGAGLALLLQARQRHLHYAGGGLLLLLMALAFWPDRQRLAAPFVDRSVSEEMRVSAFLNANVAPQTVIYANFSYADFGYYTKLQIEALPEDGPELYDALQEVPGGAIVVVYKIFEGRPPEPTTGWMDRNPRFERLQEFPTMVLYRASPVRPAG